MTYDYFRNALIRHADKMNETTFYFKNNPTDRVSVLPDICIIGYIPTMPPMLSQLTTDPATWQPRINPRPYWAGDGCDCDHGADFETADELLNAPIYGGKSIKELWDSVEVLTLGGYDIDVWIRQFGGA